MAIHITSWNRPAWKAISVGYLVKDQGDCGRIHGPIRPWFIAAGWSSYGEMRKQAGTYRTGKKEYRIERSTKHGRSAMGNLVE